MKLLPALPAAWYHSPEMHQRERQMIFAKEWLYFAHESEVREPGEYVAYELAGFPLVLVMGKDGVRRAFHNVCRHRGAPLFHGARGRVDAALSCRYHGWAYGLDGAFLSAPHLRRETLDCAALRLHEVQVGKMYGMIFVNMSAQALPLDEAMSALSADIAQSQYHFSDYRHPMQVRREGRFNWKTWVDGYQECYHCPTIHPVFNKDFSLREYKVTNRDRYAVHSCQRKAASGSPSGSREGLWLWVYPNLGLPCYESCHYTLQVNPLGPGRTQLNYSFHFAEPTSAPRTQEFLRFVDQITEEDIGICEAVQKNLEAGVFREGYLHPEREVGVRYFHSLVRGAVDP